MEYNNLVRGVLAKDLPAVIDDLNNGRGTFLYNHNIHKVLVREDEYGCVVVTTDKREATGEMVQYDSLRVEYPKTRKNIFGTLLGAKYSLEIESKLVNEYQSAELGLLPEDAKIPYQNFLKDRLAIRAMVDADCAAYDIPTDL